MNIIFGGLVGFIAGMVVYLWKAEQSPAESGAPIAFIGLVGVGMYIGAWVVTLIGE